MGKETRAIGLMGGTFNPIHYGHLVTAEAARDAFHLDRVIFIPSGQPPHKPPSVLASAEHRFLMTFLAIAPNMHFELSRVEIDRQGPSYTSETLAYFHRLDPDVDWYFISGADAILEIASWHYPEDIFRYAHLIAASRPGYSLSRIHALARELGEEKVQRIHQLEVPALAISSSQVRERLRLGLSIKYLVPEAVEHYIEKNHLYEHGP
ncbi:nicotinate-nucleotide adenylyltransferase [Sulfobacillus thermosulfidooxidans]|uniref:Probable nicotinate-nucleotide adenylyltransferase n=2 Tax=Sulfobacillus thermosulfidooxidans TaxID=28034 RepID=A0A1W1W973_SULTA|nr:nicotinate-nucleotide adenylyltransferase [Sulfobacillus thermosulfidooxidans]OLZ10828.1 nicotinate (nicotinamide) nucleotide adenylyltransferase [Sulfobacillus thermosulfidooxidans]OLZ14315.1 nicotinate (nicotinamide) nucleotide adenylyltransferase [Sulfobacillus thermosulfidooxidans]OLZ19058.1 nicotinate (nicotinamide) nucleotide adenylyltransferase [Sulfobacillus thermosulfidooxidans]PSR28566.1 MAG: nicotinate-nucleotide adenylyltransferase [Sulfobacillus thermosulfidooxidans]SMC02590.1 